MRSVAVVILNYNGKSLLQQFLPSVIRFSSQARIIVADNASTDGSVEFLKKEFSSVELILIPANLGFCGGYNYALKKIDAEYFVLLNSDVEVTEGWLEPFIELFEKNRNVAAAQPKILSHQEKNMFEYAGAAGGFIDSMGYPFCRGRIFNAIEEDKGQYNDSVPVFWASGACFFIRNRLYHEMGGLDESFFAHMEEIDLCWKLKRAGYEVFYEGKSLVYHVGGGTLSVSNPRKTFYNFSNGLSLLLHHLPSGQLIWKLPLRLLLDWTAALRFSLESPWDGFAVLRAHFHFFGNFPKSWRKRKTLQKTLSFSVTGIYRGSVVLNFFVRGKRTFREMTQ